MHNYSQQTKLNQNNTLADDPELVNQDDFDSLLIKKVKNYPEIYNKKKCKNPNSEALAWCTVADELNSTGKIIVI